ncbi:MAG: DUF354 domain-containing protein [Candidatus Bathyarchaeota archaeon]|nr:DUF354 domain-containing protein [Candidatus Bathyarchaeota archaeon]
MYKGRKILVDILTPKQVLFFEPVIDKLRSIGFKVYVSTRSFRETLWLIERRGIDARVIGVYGGRELKGKLKASLDRCLDMLRLFEEVDPDAVLCFSSPEASRVAFGLSIPLYIANDSPHAEAVAKLTLPLARKLYTPKIIPIRMWIRYGLRSSQIVRYNALDPAAWLKRFKPSTETIDKLGLNLDEPILVARFEESKSAYILRDSKSSPLPALIERILREDSKLKIVVIPRYEDQMDALEDLNRRVIVCREPVEAANLLYYASIFVGFGGTMTCEASLLGVPTLSLRFYGSYYTERYLERRGLLEAAYTFEEAVDKLRYLAGNWRILKPRLKRKAARILEAMDDPSEIISRSIASDLGAS